MTDFSSQLKNIAEKSGQKTVQGIIPDKELVVKSETKTQFAASLAKAKVKQIPEPKAEDIIEVKDLGAIATWSFSTLKKFEECPWQVKLHKIDKQKQKDSPAAQRGNLIHDMCEQFVVGNADAMIGDKKTRLDHFKGAFDELKNLYKEGIVSCEEEWGIRQDWSPCSWEDPEIWGKAKLDAFVLESETSCRIIDYKTGRKFGNELKHNDQGLSYALHAYHKYPMLDHFTIEFWYLDQAEVMKRDFTRRQLSILHQRYHKRAHNLTTAVEFTPKSNANSCRFCSYGCNKNKKGETYGTGICTFDFYRGLI